MIDINFRKMMTSLMTRVDQQGIKNFFSWNLTIAVNIKVFH